jgi:hypothetical protein
MKLFFAVLFLLSANAMADDLFAATSTPATQSPPQMVCVPVNQTPKKKHHHKKIVKKVATAPVCETKTIEKVVEVEKQVVVEKSVVKEYKNRLSLLGGAGPYYGSALDHFGSSYSLSVQYLPMLGAQYERNLDFLFKSDRWTGHVGIFTNASWFVGVGYGF